MRDFNTIDGEIPAEPITSPSASEGLSNRGIQSIRGEQSIANESTISSPQPTVDTPLSTDTGSPAAVQDTSQEARAVQVLSQMQEIQPEHWNQLSLEERVATLQNAENRMAAIQGRIPALVSQNLAGPGEFGYFDPNTNQISIGSDALENAGARENVDTVIHEGRHAYQHYAITHPGFHPDQTEVDAWQTNLFPGNYLSAVEYGQEAYMSQPVEADAWSYGNKLVNAIYGAKK